MTTHFGSGTLNVVLERVISKKSVPFKKSANATSDSVSKCNVTRNIGTGAYLYTQYIRRQH